MSVSRNQRSAARVAAAIAAAIGVPALHAAEPEEGTLTEIIVTGTRVSGVALSESATPVQLVGSEVLDNAGKPDLMGSLAQVVPSFTAQAFGGDMANQTLQAKLRGLSPNHVLVLVDGKRRHTTSNLAVLAGAYQGGAGVDLNFIPVGMVDHVEVLTDGAAAQYGTDAIAGVINIITKKDTSGGHVDATSGAYFDEGGQTIGTSGNIGLEPLPGGYMNFTVDLRKKAGSDRGGPDYRVYSPTLATISKQNAPYMDSYPYVNHISGDGNYASQLASLGSGYKFDSGVELYSLITWGHKTAASFENVRLPHQISASYNGTTVYAYPFGFNPKEASGERDYSGQIGLSGMAAGWNWDVSTVYGKDEMDVFTRDSINGSLWSTEVTNAAAAGRPVPTEFQQNFFDGTLIASQWTSSLDISRQLDTAMPVTIAFGAEYRKDTYEIVPGEPSSYYGVGAASFPGYQPFAAGKNDRNNKSIYANVVVNPVEQWTVDVAGRHEDYSDFGTVTIGKFTTRYDINDNFAVRGTYSSGFRAPTLAEEFYSAGNVGPTSTFLQMPPNSPAAIAIIGHGLEPEKSKSFSTGIVFKYGTDFLATLDAFQTKLTNRISSSSNIYGWYRSGGLGQDGTTNGLVSQPVMDIVTGFVTIDPQALADPNGTIGMNLFTNGINTRTRGVDLVASYRSAFDWGAVTWSLGATKIDNKVTSVAPLPALFLSPPRNTALFDSSQVGLLEDSSPDFVINLGALIKIGQLTANVREVIYGGAQQVTRTGSPVQDYVTKLGTNPITNLDLTWAMNQHLKFTLGAQNVFNRYPPKINKDLTAYYQSVYSNGTVTAYPTISPFGFNGGYYYGKVAYDF